MASLFYMCVSTDPDAPPPLYAWLAATENGGWTKTAVKYALKNANIGEFSAPMISLAGQKDALLALDAQATAYDEAVAAYGDPSLHRLYIIQNAPHVDKDADGLVDFDFNGRPGDEGLATQLTPMQAYVERAFQYLVDWVENGVPAPVSRTVPTDAVNDATDPSTLAW